MIENQKVEFVDYEENTITYEKKDGRWHCTINTLQYSGEELIETLILMMEKHNQLQKLKTKK